MAAVLQSLLTAVSTQTEVLMISSHPSLVFSAVLLHPKDGDCGQHQRGRDGVNKLQPKGWRQRHQHYLFSILSAFSVRGCQLHPGLLLHLPVVYGGKLPGVSNCTGKPSYAHSHQPLHPQPGDQ